MAKYLIFLITVASFHAHAAISGESWDFYKGRTYTGTKNSNIKLYREVIFSDDYEFQDRWAAVSKLARVLPKKERALFLRRCINRPEWFIKSPALKLMYKYDKDVALYWAKRLLKEDKALVIRSEAVSIIGKLKDSGSVSLLWQELYSPKNFKGNASLWIRPQIVKTLRYIEKTPNLKQWKDLFNDSDRKIRFEARKHLEAINF